MANCPIPDEARPGARAAVAPTLGLLPVLAISAAVTGPVRAQETVDLDPVIIRGLDGTDESKTGYKMTDSTSQKVLTPLADTPKTVTVVTQKQIEERGQTSLYDILRTTPGITLQAGEGGTPAGDIPKLRGFDASNDILIDGMRNASRTSYESFNLETIEISKGPGGAGNGAGAEGGTISLNTKTPRPGRFDDVTLSFGTGAYKRATLDSNREFGSFGARLNLMYQDADDLGGKKGKESKRWGVAPSFSYRFSDTTKLTAGLYYFKNEDMPDYGVRMSGTACVGLPYCVGSGTAADPWQPIDVPTDTFYGTPGRDFTDSESKSGFLRFDHEFSDTLRFSATLRKNHDHHAYLVTQPALAADGIVRGSKSGDRENETLAFNAQLTGEQDLFGLRHTFGIGFDYSKNDATQYGGFSFSPAPGNVSYVDPDLGYWTGTITEGSPSSYSTTISKTLYAFDVIDLAPKWQLSLGLSFNRYDVETETVSTGAIASVESNLVNGSIGLVYKFRDDAMLYGAISSSSKPGGLGAGTGGENASDDLNDLDPERSYSYEVGTKWQAFDDRLLLSAALFQIDKDNARVTLEDGTEDNVGKTRSRGIELGFAGQITDKWGISGGYVYQDVKLVDGGWTTPRGGGTPYPNPGNGKQLVKIPKHSFSLWTTYDYNEKMTFGAGATYVGERVASYDTAGDAVAIVPDSWQVDLMASYRIFEDTVLRLNVNNVFDEQVYGDSHATQHVYTEPGRNFVLTLAHSF